MKALTAIWAFVIIALATILVMHCVEREEFKKELAQASKYTKMSQGDILYVSSELKRLSCGDCVLTRTSYGYICREFSTGKNFRVVMK